jgi:hypothetical protein
MAFTIEVAKLVDAQLARFVTLNRHQLAGQFANLDFWISEVHHALSMIDGYRKRFQQLRAAQTKYAKDHATTVFALDDPCCTQTGPEPPRPIPDADLREARRSLCEITYRFLLRCFHESLIDEKALREICEGLNLGIASDDLRPGEPKRRSTQS